jgi:hypothetical protein
MQEPINVEYVQWLLDTTQQKNDPSYI